MKATCYCSYPVLSPGTDGARRSLDQRQQRSTSDHDHSPSQKKCVIAPSSAASVSGGQNVPGAGAQLSLDDDEQSAPGAEKSADGMVDGPLVQTVGGRLAAGIGECLGSGADLGGEWIERKAPAGGEMIAPAGSEQDVPAGGEVILLDDNKQTAVGDEMIARVVCEQLAPGGERIASAPGEGPAPEGQFAPAEPGERSTIQKSSRLALPVRPLLLQTAYLERAHRPHIQKLAALKWSRRR